MSARHREYVTLALGESYEGDLVAVLAAVRENTMGVPSYVAVHLDADQLATHIANAERLLDQMTGDTDEDSD